MDKMAEFLPQTEAIPQQSWSLASGWIPIVGRDIVACLFSRDWQLREASVRRLSKDVSNALMNSSIKSTSESGSSFQELIMADKLERYWKTAMEIIAKAAEDKVYKVYLAATKAFRTLLTFSLTWDLSLLRNGIRPILNCILIKCADGQKRMAELSLKTIFDLCNGRVWGQSQRSPLDISEFIFQLILEDNKDPSWQYCMGKLLALDHLLVKNCLLQIEHIWISLDISFGNLCNSNSRVAKVALKVFVSTSIHLLVTRGDKSAFEDVWKLVLNLDPQLQSNLTKKFKIALKNAAPLAFDSAQKIIDGLYEGQGILLSSSTLSLRSTSQSPSRPTSKDSHCQKSLRKGIKRPAPYTLKAKKKIVTTSENTQQSLDVWNKKYGFKGPIVTPSSNSGQDSLPFVPSLMPYQRWQPSHDTASPASSSPSFNTAYKEGQDWTKSFLLGSGAFSTCFQARDVQTGTLMAVKQIQLNRVQDEEEKGRLDVLLEQEINLMSVLDHPNLIRFYGAFQEDAQLNIFIEWMPGGSVSRLLDKHGPFNDKVIANYTFQILKGLDYLHSRGILHRDIKGANLFVDGSGHYLKIGDLGAAACLYNSNTCPGEFRGQLQGTLAFMAPEVLRSESYGRSCDIWSLGCCIIEMSTGRAPWNAAEISNYYRLMYKIACSQEPPEIPRQLGIALQDLAFKCLQIIPEQRPTAKELLIHPVFAEFY